MEKILSPATTTTSYLPAASGTRVNSSKSVWFYPESIECRTILRKARRQSEFYFLVVVAGVDDCENVRREGRGVWFGGWDKYNHNQITHSRLNRFQFVILPG